MKKHLFAALSILIMISQAANASMPKKMVIDLSKPIGSPDRERVIELTNDELASIEEQRLRTIAQAKTDPEPTTEERLKALEAKTGITKEEIEAVRAEPMQVK